MQFFTLTSNLKLLKNFKNLWCVLALACFTTLSFGQNANNGGTITSNQSVCIGETPEPITNVAPATGGNTNSSIEYLWMTGTNASFPGIGWTPAPGVNNQLTYTPQPVGTTTYYIRCARRNGFTAYPAESNVVTISTLPSPYANVLNKPSSIFTGETVSLSAEYSSSSNYSWDFNGDGFADCIGQNCSYTYNVPGTYTVTLTVTNSYGCVSRFTCVINVSSPSGFNSNDPCNCNDPQNVALNGTTYLNHDFVLINSTPGQNWIVSNLVAGNIFYNNGIPIPVGTSIPEVSPGVYYLDIWFDGAVGYSLRSTNGSSTTTTGPGVSVTCGCTNPLPIDLASFDALVEGETVRLKWSTLSEINNSYFELERSLDGQRFEVIGTVEGAGNSNEVLYYSFLDEKPFDGTSYYRLKQTDFDGTSEYFEVVTVKIDVEGTVFHIFPNPVKNIANIHLDENISDEAHLELFTATGKQLDVFPINQIGGIKEINLAKYPAGVYLLKLVDRSINEKVTRKLFKD